MSDQFDQEKKQDDEKLKIDEEDNSNGVLDLRNVPTTEEKLKIDKEDNSNGGLKINEELQINEEYQVSKLSEKNKKNDDNDDLETEISSDIPINAKKITLDIMSDEEYLRDRVQAQIDWHSNKSKLNQVKYKFWKRTEFILSASIPVLISFSTMCVLTKIPIGTEEHNVNISHILQIVSAVAGIALAFITKIIELEDYFKLWKDYRVIAENLEMHKMLYLTRNPPYEDNRNAYARLVETVEGILNKNVEQWKRLQQVEAKEQDKDKDNK